MHDSVAAGEQVAVAASAEYRHFGDDSALLIVVVQAHGSELPGDARLICPDGSSVAASAVTFQPDAGLARLVFAVDRGVASGAGAALHVTTGPELRVRVPEPVKRPAIGVSDGELEHAVAAGVAGDELAGLIFVLERRCAIAERVARDLRGERSDATRLAQSYREIADVRELLESREEAYRRSAERIDEADTAQREAEARADAARTELEDVRAEARAATARLEAEVAARDEAVERLEADVAELRVEAERLRAELAERGDAVERLRTELAEQATEMERLESELSATTARFDAELTATAERFDAELTAVAERRQAELAAAREESVELERQRDAALAKLEAVKQELAEASANVAAWSAELEEARTRATEAESLLEAERTLHEARLAARAGDQRNLADLFAEAQRERLRQTPAEEQRAQIQALEQQLERLKRGTNG